MGLSKLAVKSVDDQVQLVSASAVSITNAGTGEVRLPQLNGLVFTLDVTADESSALDKLNVFVQTMLDGTNWTDVVAFTQHLGSDGAKRYIGKLSASLGQTMFEAGTALAAGQKRDLIGDRWRVRYVIVDASGSAAFTFTVHACPS